MTGARLLYPATPPMDNLPIGILKYSSRDFALTILPLPLVLFMDKMAEGLRDPKYSYTYGTESLIRKGSQSLHRDGGLKKDVHRILTSGGPPTLTASGSLSSDEVWEYRGNFLHQAPKGFTGLRLMVRVSQTGISKDEWKEK